MVTSSKLPSSFEVAVELPPSTVTVPAGAEYEMTGVTENGSVEVAFRYIGDERPPAEIIPATIYEEIVDDLRSRVDFSRVAEATSTDQWPRIGTCRLQYATSTELVVSVSLDPRWSD